MSANELQQVVINGFAGDEINKALIEAQPGTGKTYTAIASAIGFLRKQLEKEADYKSKVLILTFSKNARAQVEKQLSDFNTSKDIKKLIEISNFHAFYQKYIWAYKLKLGFPNLELRIPSEKQRKELLNHYLCDIDGFDASIDEHFEWVDSILEVDLFESFNSRKKNKVRSLLQYKDAIKSAILNMNQDGFIGFSDMGHHALRLLDSSNGLCEVLRGKYPFIIIDEYQDVSDIQDELINRLIRPSSKTLYFADSLQQIYEWRGAKNDRLRTLLDSNADIFSSSFEENYRFGDCPDIVEHLQRIRNDIPCTYEDSTNIKYIKSKVDVSELNRYIPQAWNKMKSSMVYTIGRNIPRYDERRNESVGILCFSNEQVLYYKKKLNEIFHIRTKNINNNSLEHNVIGDMIDFMNSKNLTSSKEELIKECIRFLFDVCEENQVGSLRSNQLSNKSEVQLRRMTSPVVKLIIKIIDEQNEVEDLFDLYKEVFKVISNCNALNIVDDIRLLLRKVFERKVDVAQIQRIFLMHQHTQSHKELRGVYVLNFHQSKGREFDYVFIVDEDGLKSNRNLNYVACSRVKKKLFILNWELKD